MEHTWNKHIIHQLYLIKKTPVKVEMKLTKITYKW